MNRMEQDIFTGGFDGCIFKILAHFYKGNTKEEFSEKKKLIFLYENYYYDLLGGIGFSEFFNKINWNIDRSIIINLEKLLIDKFKEIIEKEKLYD